MRTLLATILLATATVSATACGDSDSLTAIPQSGTLVCALDADGIYVAQRLVCDATVKKTVGTDGDVNAKGQHCYVRLHGERVAYVSENEWTGEYFTAQDPIECVAANF